MVIPCSNRAWGLYLGKQIPPILCFGTNPISIHRFQHNSVADLMWMALNTPASRRTVFSLLLTYAASMIWMLPQTSYEDSNDPNVNVVLTWVFRILLSMLTSWHIGAGVSVFFLVRELTPNRTFKTVFKLKTT